MPIYEFECPEGTVTERLVGTDTGEIECPKCHKKAGKIMSLCAFHLKGGGWAADGYSSGQELRQDRPGEGEGSHSGEVLDEP
jgi:putative FmdB family regulatory protein